MNRFTGNIAAIDTSEGLSCIHVRVANTLVLQVLLVGTPALSIGQELRLACKETNVLLAQKGALTTVQNTITGTVQTLEQGIVLSKVTVATSIGVVTTVIASSAITSLALTVGIDIDVLMPMHQIYIT